MAADELSTPLGQKRGRLRRFRLPFTATQAIATVLGLFLLAFLGFALFNNDPLGGEPMVRITLKPSAPQDNAAPGDKAQIDKAQPDKAPAEKGLADKAPADKSDMKAANAEATAGPGQKTITIIDGSSGSRQNVVVSTGDDKDSASAAAPATSSGIDPRLLEQSRYGMIPVAAGTLKPFSAYAMATDADRAKADKTPSVAIVVTGLGVGAARTNDAVLKLPRAVALAFTPYGSEPGKLVEDARAKQHEVLLQLPMEPFDYPDNDPGPQTLLSTSAPEQNIDRLNWHLSRFQGYVGVSNFMGARFVATEAAMQPIIRDAAKRGLGYLDDGAAPRSVAGSLAKSLAMPFGRADLTIDTVPTAAEIDKALARLEALAKERGNAIGVASALPVSIERIVSWSKSLENRGVVLVPLTTAMLKSKST